MKIGRLTLIDTGNALLFDKNLLFQNFKHQKFEELSFSLIKYDFSLLELIGKNDFETK